MGEHGVHGFFYTGGGLGLLQAKAQHHGGAQNGGQRVGHALAGDVRGAAVAGLVQALIAAIEAGRGQHADGAGEHGGFVAQDVAKHIAGHHHVKALGLLDQLHGCVVHIHMV